MSNTLDPLAYEKLKKVARYYMSGERVNHTLCPTALVNEAFLKFYQSSAADQSDFLIQAARNMRQILVNHALARNAQKRGGGGPTLLSFDDQVGDQPELDILELDDALKRLEQSDPVKARIVELRYFSGLTNEEVGQELGISIATVKRRWTAARAWLYRELA